MSAPNSYAIELCSTREQLHSRQLY